MPPTHRCERGNATFLPHCIVWGKGTGCRADSPKFHSFNVLGAFVSVATGGQYKNMRYPLILWAGSTLAPLAAFSSSVASGSEKLTSGLQPLFFALALNHWALDMSIVLYQEEANRSNVNVLLNRHYRLHIFNELQLLMQDAQPVSQDTWRCFLI